MTSVHWMSVGLGFVLGVVFVTATGYPRWGKLMAPIPGAGPA